MEEFLNEYGYPALLAGSFLEGETAILISASLVNSGLFELQWTILAGFAGSFVSDWIYYLIGRLNGKYFIERRPALKAKVAPVRKFFNAHKLQILFSYRFLYGFRMIIPLIIGMSDVGPVKYLGYSLAAGLIWSATVNAAGYFIGYFLDIRTSVFESNIMYIIAGFAAFGLLMGFLVKRFAEARIAADD